VASTKARKVVAVALYRVVSRNMAAGRSLAYETLLAETAAEVDVLLDKQRKRDARLLRRARRQVLEAQVRLAAVTEARARAAGDAGRQLADLEAALGPSSWHPDHPGNDL
jgi:hypothetical protein